MAHDAYLQLDGVKGESADERHKNWIEVFSVTGSVHQPRAVAISTAGGLTTGRAELSNISFKKLADLSSPVLKQHSAMGKTLPKAVFEFMRADSDGKPITYYRVTLENVMVSGITFDSSNGGIITEQVHLAYSKIKWEYVKQSVRGGTEGNTLGSWDQSTNKVA